MPTRSAWASSPRRWAGMAWTNDASGRGWIAIFGGSCAAPGRARAVIVTWARRSRSSMSGIAAVTSAALNHRSGGIEALPDALAIVRHSRPRGTRSRHSVPGGRYDPPVPSIDLKQSVDNLKLERDAIALYDALS